MDDLSCLGVGDRERLRSRSLHVLLVESDLAVLNRRGTRLLEEGFVVSTRRAADRLFEAMARLTPDLVLVDPFMPGLDLTLLLARGRSRSLPAAVALHTKVPQRILCAVLELGDFAGAIRKTDDDEAFIAQLQAIADALPARVSQSDSARFLAPSSSGTHRIGEPREVLRKPRLVRGA
jgi:CheY-like chemotaxis protein